MRSLQSKFLKITTTMSKRSTEAMHQHQQHVKRPKIKYPIPEKSHSDKKNYRIIKLTNGLKAILVSDLKTTTTTSTGVNAAVALQVDTGNFDDPKEIPGMAHFVEHMLFMGSTKYPRENEYDLVISKNGGENNAETEAEETCFYFRVPQNVLKRALDVFSNLLADPLFNTDSMDREMNAIDAEFDQVKQDDGVRCDEVISKFANKSGPHSRFTWGTKETLCHLSLAELKTQVQTFWETYYSADRMYLCIQAALDLDKLEVMAEEYFTKIPCSSILPNPKINLSHKDAFQDSFYKNVIYVNSVENKIELNLIWVLPSQIYEFKCKPAHFLEHLLEHKGPGGLAKCLKTRNLAQYVGAGVSENGSETNRLFSIFYLTIKLSKYGYENVELVLELVYSYLKMLRKDREQLAQVYNEVKAIHETEFKFQNEPELLENVQNLTTFLKYFPDENVLNGNELYFEYDPELVYGLLDHLNDQPRGTLICSQMEMDYDLEEYFTKAKYKTVPMPLKWEHIRESASMDHPEFHLPPGNPFITSNFQLVHNAETIVQVVQFPRLIFESDICQLYFKEDIKFRLPKVYVGLHLIVPLGLKDCQNSVLLEVFMKLINIELQQCLAGAVVAGYSCEGKIENLGIELKLGGYSEKLPQLMDTILEKIVTFGEFATEPAFALVKEEMLCLYANQLLTVDALNDELRLGIIEEIHWSAFEKYQELDKITFENVIEFSGNVFKELKLKSLIQGNISEAAAIALVRNIAEKLKSGPVNKNINTINRSLQIPGTHSTIRVRGTNKRDENSALCHYYQIGPDSVKQSCKLQLLMMILEEPLFDQLRTKKQLGYDVYNNAKVNYGLLGFTVTIISQETKNTTEVVDNEMEQFVTENFKTFLEELDDEEFDESRTSLIELKQVDDTDLMEEMNRNWQEVLNDTFFFNRIDTEIFTLMQIEKEEVVRFFKDYVTSENVRKLSVQVKGSIVTDNPKELDLEIKEPTAKVDFKLEFETDIGSKSGRVIDNIKAFKVACKPFDYIDKRIL